MNDPEAPLATPAPAGAEPVGAADLTPRPSPTAGAPPPWFRVVVWDSLLGSLCPLLPLPFVDEMMLSRLRQRLVARVLAGWGSALTPAQVALLAGRSAPWTVGRVAKKAVVYPLKRLFRKVLYFLAMKEAVDTLSLLFHQGYLLHVAAARGAFAGGPDGSPPDDARVAAVADAVHATLAATDTRPLGQLVLGVFRNSRRLFVGTFRWLAARLGRPSAITELEAEGADPARLHDGSPEAEKLVDRVASVLWGQERYRQRLERQLASRLAAPAAAPR